MSKNPSQPPKNQQRWPWIVLGTGLVMGGAAAFAPTLLGDQIISRYGKPAGLNEGKLSGPLWAPKISNSVLSLPGIKVKAGEVGVQLTGINPLTKTVRLKVKLHDMVTNVDLAELLKNQTNTQPEGEQWKVVVDGIDVQNAKLKLDGKELSVPNLDIQIASPNNHELELKGQAGDGQFSSHLKLGSGPKGQTVTADFNAEARILRSFWNGVEDGQLIGRYEIGQGPLKGNIQVKNMLLRVPEAQFTEIKNIDGQIDHQGDQIDLKLAGEAWDGPITATGQANLKKQQWSATAKATPTLAGLGQALNTNGQGDLKLDVTAGGWTDFDVQANIQSQEGTLGGLPFTQLKADYYYEKEAEQEQPKRNQLVWNANTQLSGDQKLSGDWQLGQQGRMAWKGQFANAPLDLKADIDAQNIMDLSGKLLGGPAQVQFNPKGLEVSGTLQPKLSGVQAKLQLSGQVTDLTAKVSDGLAGPFPLEGTVWYNEKGLKADLKGLQLDLDKSLAGTWQVDDFAGGGVSLTGQGQLDLAKTTLDGQLRTQLPSLDDPLQGQVSLNFAKLQGQYLAGRQRLLWKNDQIDLSLQDLKAQGASLNGDLKISTALDVRGKLTAKGNGYDLKLQGLGKQANLQGSVSGVNLSGQTQLEAPFQTQLKVNDTDIQANIRVQDGVRFSVLTRGQNGQRGQAQGVLNGADIDATGRIYLDALKPLAPALAPSGTLDLNLAGQRGNAKLTASVKTGEQNADIVSTFIRRPTGEGLGAIDTRLSAQTQVNGKPAQLQLTGQVFPEMNLRGPAQWMEQKLNARLSGAYSNLNARIWGRTDPLTFQGVSLPAQQLNIQGSVTPQAQLDGNWGDLQLSFNANTGRLLVSGQQEITASGRTGMIQTRAEWGSDFQGRLQAKGQLDDYRLQLDGPWRDIKLQLSNSQGLSGRGTLSVPDTTYDFALKGPIPLQAQTLNVDGTIRGQGANPKVSFFVADGLGGRGTLKLSSLENLDFSAQSLKIAGYKLDGNLRNQDGQLNGRATLGPLDVIAQNGQVSAKGTLAGQDISASAKVKLPSQLSDIQLRVNGPYAQIRASGSMERLSGQVQLKEQTYGSEQAKVHIPAQSYPLSARLQGTPQVLVGGLQYNGGNWQGALTADYRLSSAEQQQTGKLRLLGQAETLSLQPTGAVTGRVQVLPKLSGTVSGKLSAFSGLLPDNIRPKVKPGQIVAQIRPKGADLSLQQTQYLNQPLGLKAEVTWQDGVQARGALTHPGTRLPVEYDGQNLRIQQGVLDAQMLSPMLPEASGVLKVNVNVPKMDFEQASGRADVDLTAQNLKAKGHVNLQAGQVSAFLSSTLPGQEGPLELQGRLYPAADARLQLGNLTGTLRGHAERQLVLKTQGDYQGRQVDLTATANAMTQKGGQLNIQGLVAGAKLDLQTKRSTANPSDWPTSGTISVPDLKALAGTKGQVQAVLGGTLSNLALTASGQAAGISFTAPAKFKDGQLRLTGAKAKLPQGQVSASGQVFPALSLKAKANLQEGLPGEFTAQIGGSYNKPDVQAKGILSESKTGLQAAGTPVKLRLLGKDWKAQFAGPAIRGQVRGQLGANSAGGLLSSQLQLDTAYLSEGNHIKLRGQNGWNAKDGWTGRLKASGQTKNGLLHADLIGDGPLKLNGFVGTGSKMASFDGTLAADLPLKPGGQINMTRLDAGAFWQRPGELTATGTALLSGPAWNKLSASFKGELQDRGKELSGQLTAEYRAGNAKLKLNGQKISGQASLQDGRYQANFKAQKLDAARLLPPNMNVDALTFAGRFNAAGSLADGPEHLAGENLAIQGQTEQAGPFSLYGSAEYRPGQSKTKNTEQNPDVLNANLWGSLRGGLIKAKGALPNGLNIQLDRVAANYGSSAPLGQGTLDGNIKLTGPLANPQIQGSLNALTNRLDAKLMLNGTAQQPQANARVKLLGDTRGTVYADLRNPDWQAGTLQAKVYGLVESGNNRAQFDLAGTWPKLHGELVAKVPQLEEPLKLEADGQGHFTVQNGHQQLGKVALAAGTGWLPEVSGQIDFNALDLLPKTQKDTAKGQAQIQAQIGGTLSAPQISGQLHLADVQVGGLKIPSSTGGFQLGEAGFSGLLQQKDKQVATFDSTGAKIQGFSFNAAGSHISATGTLSGSGQAKVNLQSKGAIKGNVKAEYIHQQLNLTGQVNTQGLKSEFKIGRNPLTGWNGKATVAGGPKGVLTEPLSLKLRGTANHPLLTGEGGMLGAGARLIANSKMVQLRLIDGDETKAKGVLELRPNKTGEWIWSGKAQLKRPELNVQLEPTGPIADPRVAVNLRQGEWNASGTASLKDTRLDLTDGLKQGHLRWDGQQLRANIPGFDLAQLGFEDLQGKLLAKGQMNKEGTGQIKISMIGLSAAGEIPALGLPIQGNLATTVDLKKGRASISGNTELSNGSISFKVRQVPESGQWLGHLIGNIRRQEGQLNFDVGATSKGLEGKAMANAYPIKAAGREIILDGEMDLQGQTMSTQLSGKFGTGTLEMNAEGGLANLVPALSGPLAVQPIEDDYNLSARLNKIDLKALGIMPALAGTISGEGSISAGGGTFFLESNQLKLGPQKTVKTRVEGTQVAGNWRLRGLLDDTEFFGGLSKGELFGDVNLRGLPLGAMVAAATGEAPGEGLVTGLATFRFPVADPLAGSATVVAERIRVSTQAQPANANAEEDASDEPNEERLLGFGTLDFANRELKNLNIQLSGAGTWDVQGQYTRKNVDLKAKFAGTTFTPVLRLIPNLAQLDPALKGSISLSATGTYQRPRGILRAADLEGKIAGFSLKVPTMYGDLLDSGTFTGGSKIQTGGSVSTDGKLTLKGQLSNGKLSHTKLQFRGLLAPKALGELPNSSVKLFQQADGWAIDARSTSRNPVSGRGYLRANGQITPKWDLKISSDNYNLPISTIYAKETALDANIQLKTVGDLLKISGAADFQRMTLGRVDVPAVLPPPGGNTTQPEEATAISRHSNFNSPLPEKYTKFPKPKKTTTEQQSPEETTTSSPSFLERLMIQDLIVVAPNGIRVDENLARAEFSTTGLRVSGTGAAPTIAGRITPVRGSIFLRENEFKITSGNIQFTGQNIYPTFNITARGNVSSASTKQNVPITLNFQGDFRVKGNRANVLHLTTNLQCSDSSTNCTNPDTGLVYGEAELYALIATGIPDLNSLPNNLKALGTSALQTALNVFMLGEVERTLARAFNLDVVRLTPTLSNEDGINATFTVGSYITRDLFLQYQVDLQGRGLVNATYTTDDGRFTLKASTPFSGLDIDSIRPNFSAAYNFGRYNSLSLGVETKKTTSTLKFGVKNKF